MARILVTLTLTFALIVPVEAAQKEIVSLSPLWLTTTLRERGVERAAISLCGGDLLPCSEAKRRLRRLTAVCPEAFLGIVDLGKHPGTPKNLYGATDPELIILMRPMGEPYLVRYRTPHYLSPDTVALVLCYENTERGRLALRGPVQ